MFKSTLYTEQPAVGEVWLSTVGNYFRIDKVVDRLVSVTRLGYTTGYAQDYLSRKKHGGDSHVFNIDSFPTLGRRIARKALKFEAFLNQTALNGARLETS